jgi:glycosyltransferase involved in cell wall biosynthesis
MTHPIIIATIMRPEGETGVQTHFNALIDYLNANDQPVELITPYSAPLWLVYPLFAVRKLLKGPLSVWWYRYWHAFFVEMSLIKRLKNDSPFTVYAQCPLSANAALNARFSNKQRVVMVTHFNISQAEEWAGKGMIAKSDKLYQSIQNFEETVLPRMDGLVFVSEFMKQELQKRIPAICNVNTTVVPNFLADPGLNTHTETTADLINIGTLEARKNQSYLLDIIAALREQGTPLTLTIVGDGPDRSLLENKAKDLDITDLVSFAGFVANAAELITSHKAYIHVAIIENLPVTLLEALARSCPIFAVPAGGVPEILNNNAVGLALPFNDAKSAAQTIANALKNQQWLLQTRISSRETFLKKYSDTIAAENLYYFLKNTDSITNIVKN